VAEPIPIRPYPRQRVFRPELQAAVAHAFSHPLLPAARQDAERLAGVRLTDAFWTLREWTLVFDNGTELRVWPEEPQVRWRLAPRGPAPSDEAVSGRARLSGDVDDDASSDDSSSAPFTAVEDDASAVVRRAGEIMKHSSSRLTGGLPVHRPIDAPYPSEGFASLSSPTCGRNVSPDSAGYSHL
jgi:hypothetical protein